MLGAVHLGRKGNQEREKAKEAGREEARGPGISWCVKSRAVCLVALCCVQDRAESCVRCCSCAHPCRAFIAAKASCSDGDNVVITAADVEEFKAMMNTQRATARAHRR